MSFELTMQLACGTMNHVIVLLTLITCAKEGNLLRFIPSVLLNICYTAVTILLPCELTQRALNTISDTRDLLLTRSEWQMRPELQSELCLFRETVTRDLDTLGDLGLFRLRRSTILSIFTTVLTYVIVMLQFYVTELTA